MTRRLLLAAALALVTAAGCAVSDARDEFAPPPATARVEDPARIGLPAPFRVFYDELKDEGDWTLIEPYGWVFRPRVNFVAWRPYQDGWWEPSDSYGWIWDTYEPFGWITYHYGAWFYDEYQGWVWQPGGVWGPAWVAWVDAGEFVGWAPLAPVAYDDFDRIPDGLFTFAPVQQFAARNVGQAAVHVTKLPQATRQFREILNVGHANGVAFNRGPDPVLLMQRGGGVGEAFDDSALPRVKLAGPPQRITESDLQSRTARLVTAGRIQLRRLLEDGIAPPPAPGGAPPMLPPPPAGGPRFKPPSQPAPPDTVRIHRPARPRAPADTTATGRRHVTKRPARPADAAPDSTRDD